jgi:molybdenum cofactor cytidylyltransferase
MKFVAVPLSQAQGKILGHNIAGLDGRRLLKKGKALDAQDIAALASIGREAVYVAELEPDDINENEAARRIAAACVGRGLSLVGPSAGRVNLLAQGVGVLRVDVGRLERINTLEGLTISTRLSNTLVKNQEMVATVKIIPYSLPLATINAVAALAAEDNASSMEFGALVKVDLLTIQPVSLIFSGSASLCAKLDEDFAPLIERVEGLGSFIATTDYISLDDTEDESQLVKVLLRRAREGAKLILLAGETAIMDRYDIIPRALERAGGRVEVIGVPVDPGNLLMLGYLGSTPVLGAPGCARSKKVNIIDWVLPRLLAGDTLQRGDFIRLGHGGLLDDTQQRPMPRSQVEAEKPPEEGLRKNVIE